jgi:hypothetical protein
MKGDDGGDDDDGGYDGGDVVVLALLFEWTVAEACRDLIMSWLKSDGIVEVAALEEGMELAVRLVDEVFVECVSRLVQKVERAQ